MKAVLLCSYELADSGIETCVSTHELLHCVTCQQVPLLEVVL
jgi:hypothetical protein